MKSVQEMITNLVKVCWERDQIKEETWKTETQMRIDYSELFHDGIGQSVHEPNFESSPF